ncbi:MAG: iron-sulfur cluster assembly scaffold protein [Desulfobacterales bacterium]|nr:iron-sulfur cluster assembly scaffold protein [Desulfobacterales bacterium]
MNGANVFLGAGVLLVVAVLWFAVYYWLNPHLSQPDGKARITGSCGDVMEIRLAFENHKVVDSSQWTNGCVHSYNCVLAAADLAKNKKPEEIFDIDAEAVRHAVGGLPADHMHCAGLAVETLYAAVDDYMRGVVANKQ